MNSIYKYSINYFYYLIFFCTFAKFFYLVMSKLKTYDIDLKNILTENKSVMYNYILTKDYFQALENSEISNGDVKAKLNIIKQSGYFIFEFNLEGSVWIECTRCLDDMQQPINYSDTIKVKLSEKESENDDIVTVSQQDGIINVAWYLYEFIMLNIPLVHTHNENECNKEVLSKLNGYITQSDEIETENKKEEIDPRWAKLKNIFEND